MSSEDQHTIHSGWLSTASVILEFAVLRLVDMSRNLPKEGRRKLSNGLPGNLVQRKKDAVKTHARAHFCCWLRTAVIVSPRASQTYQHPALRSRVVYLLH